MDAGIPRVSFRKMSDGTADDFRIVAANDRSTDATLYLRILTHLEMQAEDDGAYLVSRLEHVLQTATRAERDGASEDWIVGCLLHDVGDVLAPHTHGEVAAEIIRPFVDPEVTWVVRHHGLFQRFYNASLSNEARQCRDKFRDQPHFQAAVDFCERWDQVSFDPDYESYDLQHFSPALQRVFAREPFWFQRN